jgi:hypothetical protein
VRPETEEKEEGKTVKRKGRHRDAHFDARVKAALSRENTPRGKMFTRKEIVTRAMKALRLRRRK